MFSRRLLARLSSRAFQQRRFASTAVPAPIANPMQPITDFMKLPAGFAIIFGVSGAYVAWDIERLQKETTEDDRAHFRSVYNKMLNIPEKELLTRMEHIRKHFADHNGHLDAKEMTAFLEQEFNVVEDGTIWVRALDTSEDEKVSYAELVSGALIFAGAGDKIEHSCLLRLNFDLMDTDKSGTADKSEIKTWLAMAKRLGYDPVGLQLENMDKSCQKIFSEFDKKSKGYLNYEEFSKMFDRYFSQNKQ